MALRIACSIFTIAVLAEVRTADACWLPGGDGSCPSGGLGGGGPTFHSYGDPRLIKLDGVALLEVFSADDADQYTQYAGDVREELALPTPSDGSSPALVPTVLPDGYAPSFACGTACLAAWHTEPDPTVRAAIRDASGWSMPIAFEEAIRAPAAAAFGDVMLVAWSQWVSDAGARVELRRVDRAGRVTGSWRLATGASHGHLSVTQTAIGGLVTWQRTDQTPASTTISCWVDAQLLDATGAPAGAVIEQQVSRCDGDYDRGAPAVFAGGVYRVVHGGLGPGVPWFVVDPAARTIALDPLEGAAGPISQIVALADGFALAIDAYPASVARIRDGRVAQALMLDGAATLEPVADGGLTAAYANAGSVYLTAIPSTFDAVAEPQVVAARYQVDGGGCATARGGGGGLVALGLLALRRRRQVSARVARARCAG